MKKPTSIVSHVPGSGTLDTGVVVPPADDVVPPVEDVVPPVDDVVPPLDDVVPPPDDDDVVLAAGAAPSGPGCPGTDSPVNGF